MSRTETKGEQKRTTPKKQNTSNSSYLLEEVTLQIVSLCTKPFVIFMDALFKVDAYFKRWFNRKSNFCCQVKLNNNYLYSFGHREKVVLFVCFALKCERTGAFLIRLPNWFSLCLDSDKKILPLCY